MNEWLSEMAVQGPIALVIAGIARHEVRRLARRVEAAIMRDGAATRQALRHGLGCPLSDHRDAIAPPAPNGRRQ